MVGTGSAVSLDEFQKHQQLHKKIADNVEKEQEEDRWHDDKVMSKSKEGGNASGGQ